MRTVRNECLDHLLVFGRRHLEQILRGYLAHFNGERPHRSLELVPPAGAPRSRGSPPAEIRRRVTERLGWVGLKDVEQMKPASLSGGMRKRVGLARALAMDPEIILYDEPTTGLDPITGDVINQLIRALQHQLGVTSVVVTHDLMSAYKVGDRLAMLYQGRVVFIGTPDEVRETDHPMVRQFIEGSSVGPIQPV